MGKYRYLMFGLLCFLVSAALVLFGHREQRYAANWELGISPPIYEEIERRYDDLMDNLSGAEAEIATELHDLFQAGEAEKLRTLWHTSVEDADVSEELKDFAEYLVGTCVHFVDQEYAVLLREIPRSRHDDAKRALDLYVARDMDGLTNLRRDLYHSNELGSTYIVEFIDEIMINRRAASQHQTVGVVLYVTGGLFFFLGIGLCFVWARGKKQAQQLSSLAESNGQVEAGEEVEEEQES